jgi:hypothetical protein
MKKLLLLMSESRRKRLALAIFRNQAEFLNALGRSPSARRHDSHFRRICQPASRVAGFQRLRLRVWPQLQSVRCGGGLLHTSGDGNFVRARGGHS